MDARCNSPRRLVVRAAVVALGLVASAALVVCALAGVAGLFVIGATLYLQDRVEGV